MGPKTAFRGYVETKFVGGNCLHLEELESVCGKVREEAVDMILKDGSGHLGGSLSCVELVLYILNKNPNAKLILSKGHAGPVLYAAGQILKFTNDKDVPSKFRQPFTRYQGHPEQNHPLVMFNTGVLSTGLVFGVGLAKACLDENPKNPDDVFVICGDGEMGEPLVKSAMIMAVKYQLRNLYIIVDHNGYQIDGPVKEINNSLEFLKRGFSRSFCVALVRDGHSLRNIDRIFNLVSKDEK